MNIMPTHKCFDDALELLTEFLVKEVHAEADLRLVHAVCIAPDGHEYSHAWVETGSGLAFFCGLLYGRKVTVEVEAGEYRENVQAKEIFTYTPREAWEHNKKFVTYGPWEERLLVLCARPGEGLTFRPREEQYKDN